jgi:ankyrin repeat protein
MLIPKIFVAVVFMRCEFDAQDRWTPLHFAAWGGYDAIIDALYGAGADVDARNQVRRS